MACVRDCQTFSVGGKLREIKRQRDNERKTKEKYIQCGKDRKREDKRKTETERQTENLYYARAVRCLTDCGENDEWF